MSLKIELLCKPCRKCETFKERLGRAVKLTGAKIEMTHITDYRTFSKYTQRVSETPLVFINGELEFAKEVPFLEVLTKKLNDLKSGKDYDII